MLTKEHFETRMDKVGDGCWLWVGAVDSNGYGAVKVNGKRRSTHRVAFELYKGPLPEGTVACHTCNVKPCVNPDHLYAGSRSDNMRDFLALGHSSPKPRRLARQDAEDI